jgi:hypothetical protein
MFRVSDCPAVSCVADGVTDTAVGVLVGGETVTVKIEEVEVAKLESPE